MSILDKAENKSSGKKKMMKRIYKKLKSQEKELSRLSVTEVKYNEWGDSGYSISLDLKNRNWLSLYTYFIYIIPAGGGKLKYH